MTNMNETNLSDIINEPKANTDVAQDHGEIGHNATLFGEPIAHIGAFPITNALVTSWFAVFIIIILATALRLKMKSVPSRLQHFFEIVLEGGLSLADQVTGSRQTTQKVFPLAISIFFFVLINNWLGILPLGGFGILERGSEGIQFIPFLRSGTADINTTLMLSVVAVIGSNLFGIVSTGIWKMFNKYVNLKALAEIPMKVRLDPSILLVAPIMFFVGVLELVGELAKIASLSFRLFGNVFAGEVLLVSMAALFAYGLPIPFLFLEVMVGVIQALIISMLTLVYFTIAAQDHSEHEESGHKEHPTKVSLLEKEQVA